ncbi:MAG: aspartate/glutamate racemase family protein [Synergistetes bacterium]|nr:aspartate/glutamate racemase family protein [Synergistota bacterium]MDW8192374.1 aspartate/glutamate racemase family protein [Synergistota bacterium]
MRREKAVLGILMLETRFPRIIGDVGNPQTYPFPVKLKKVSGANLKTVVWRTETSLINAFLEGAKELEKEGVKAITTSCGFTILFQDKLAQEVKVPVFASSLIMIPWVYKMIRGKIGVITANSRSLSQAHLEAAGANGIPVVIKGLEGKEEFRRVILEDSPDGDFTKIEKEVLETAKELVIEHPDIRGFVFECHNLPPYTPRVQMELGLPVFDFLTLAQFVYDSIANTP